VFMMSIHTDNRAAMFKRDTKTKWQTPLWFFRFFDNQYHFEWDMAASKKNRLCKKYVNQKMDATSFDWPSNSSLWCNPPYDSRRLHLWFERGWDAARHGSTVVFLVHARTDTVWYHEWAIRGHVGFVRGRMKFLYKDRETDAAPFPSLVVIYDPKAVENYEKSGIDLLHHFDGFCIDGRLGTTWRKLPRYPRAIVRYPRKIIRTPKPKHWSGK